MSNIIERFKNDEFVVHCETEEQAKEFIKICYDNELHWYASDKGATNWGIYGKFTCYRAEDYEIMYCNTDFYKRDDYEIITFDKFMEEYRGMKKQFTKADLKSGMIVVLRDGAECVVVKDIATVWTEENPFGAEHETNDIIVNGNSNYWEYLDNYNDDLNSIEYSDSDIMKVYLASHPYCMQKFEYEQEKRELLWEREDVKELTIEEISKLLGYKVRVIGGKD